MDKNLSNRFVSKICGSPRMRGKPSKIMLCIVVLSGFSQIVAARACSTSILFWWKASQTTIQID